MCIPGEADPHNAVPSGARSAGLGVSKWFRGVRMGDFEICTRMGNPSMCVRLCLYHVHDSAGDHLNPTRFTYNLKIRIADSKCLVPKDKQNKISMEEQTIPAAHFKHLSVLSMNMCLCPSLCSYAYLCDCVCACVHTYTQCTHGVLPLRYGMYRVQELFIIMFIKQVQTIVSFYTGVRENGCDGFIADLSAGGGPALPTGLITTHAYLAMP